MRGIIVGALVVVGVLALVGLVDAVWGRSLEVDEDLAAFNADRQSSSLRFQRR